VGSVGTAALLNVGESLSNLLKQLALNGFNIGDANKFSGDSISSAIRYLYSDATSNLHRSVIYDELKSSHLKEGNFEVIYEEIGSNDLKFWLGKESTTKMEKQWGNLDVYTGIGAGRPLSKYSDSRTVFKVFGLKFGNFLLGMQPVLGIEGDPMRLLFERDLTPHPQYAAFYQYLNRIYEPHVMIHFGMHGTVRGLMIVSPTNIF